ncbi:MAG: hypothetical protein ACK4WC_01170 [Rubrimonas sp.]
MIRKILEAIADFIDDVLSPQPQPRPIPVRVHKSREPHHRGEPR